MPAYDTLASGVIVPVAEDPASPPKAAPRAETLCADVGPCNLFTFNQPLSRIVRELLLHFAFLESDYVATNETGYTC